MPQKNPIGIRFTLLQLQRIDRHAKATGTPRNAIVKQAIDVYLDYVEYLYEKEAA